MIYSESAPMADAKSWFAPTLGLWHSYKQGNIEVFRLYSNDILMGLHFRMTPGQPFYLKKKKLSPILMILSWIRLAYPRFREDLMSAIASMEADNSTARAGYRHLKNIKFLCEWYIPVVRRCILVG